MSPGSMPFVESISCMNCVGARMASTELNRLRRTPVLPSIARTSAIRGCSPSDLASAFSAIFR